MMMLVEPLYQNIAACLVTVVYIQAAVAACDIGVSTNVLSPNLSRTLIHCAASAWCLFWPFFNEDHWTWRLNVTIPATYSVQLIVKGLIIPDPNDPAIKTMMRSGRQPIELCQEPLTFVLILLYSGLFEFKTTMGIYIMASMGIGGGAMLLAGHICPLGYYKTFGKGQYNSISGTVGMFVGTLRGVFLLRAAIRAPVTVNTAEIMGLALIATVVEAVAGIWDGPLTVAAILCYMHVRSK